MGRIQQRWWRKGGGMERGEWFKRRRKDGGRGRLPIRARYCLSIFGFLCCHSISMICLSSYFFPSPSFPFLLPPPLPPLRFFRARWSHCSLIRSSEWFDWQLAPPRTPKFRAKSETRLNDECRGNFGQKRSSYLAKQVIRSISNNFSWGRALGHAVDAPKRMQWHWRNSSPKYYSAAWVVHFTLGWSAFTLKRLSSLFWNFILLIVQEGYSFVGMSNS